MGSAQAAIDVNVHLLILSWGPDAPWLHYALRSIQRFARGFSGVTVVYPMADDAIMRPVCEQGGAVAYPHDEPPPPFGHLAQMITKAKADIYCPDATHVMHFDSDCIFIHETSPEDYMRGERPVLVYRRWEDAKDAICWREPTARCLGWDPPFETMARMPLMYDARVYPMVREHIRLATGAASFEAYVMGCKPTFPYGWCEFNAIGGFLLERAPGLCAPVLVGPRPWEGLPDRVRQLWSHDDLTPEMSAWLEETIEGGGEKRPPPAAGPMTEQRRKLLGLA